MNHRWTSQERKYLRDNYPTISTQLIADKLGITLRSVKTQAIALCLRKLKQNGELRRERGQGRRERDASSKTEKLAKQGIYTMSYFDGRESPPLRKQQFGGIKSGCNGFD